VFQGVRESILRFIKTEMTVNFDGGTLLVSVRNRPEIFRELGSRESILRTWLN